MKGADGDESESQKVSETVLHEQNMSMEDLQETGYTLFIGPIFDPLVTGGSRPKLLCRNLSWLRWVLVRIYGHAKGTLRYAYSVSSIWRDYGVV